MISFEDFQKVELRVGKVVAAQHVEGSEKLLRLEVDLGEEKCQIIAGVGLRYSPEEMANRQIVVVVNLQPRMIMGLESQGMLLAADSPNGPDLLMPDHEAPLGSKIR